MIPVKQRRKFFKLLSQGESIRQAAIKTGISYSTAKTWAKSDPDDIMAGPTARKTYWQREATSSGGETLNGVADIAAGPVPFQQLCERARRGWEDFEFFRRTYLGHISTPWQIETANAVLERLATPDKEFLTVNMPPGTGKTTFVHDLAAWLTVRDRSIRGLIGSRTGNKAQSMLRNLKDTFERTTPYTPKEADVRRGLACNAEATLIEDYGIFKPLVGADLWRREAFNVAQPGGAATGQKEPTWQAMGLDQDFLGYRYDVMFWDDAIVPRDLNNLELLTQLFDDWDSEVESRLEPGGAFFLVGQRIGGNDLYRYCLDKKRPPTEEEQDQIEEGADLDLPPQYTHIVYKAHTDELCRGKDTHHRNAAPFPEGCLLDPKRVTWRDLLAIQTNNPHRYATWYQQEDADPESVLVRQVWVDGGTDPETGVFHPGCWDHDRDICELPAHLPGALVSVATIDPSPTKFWAIQWWVYCPELQTHFLMDTMRRKMPSDAVLNYDPLNRAYTGVMEEWQRRSERLGYPISHWIFEVNTAQRWFLEGDIYLQWLTTRKTEVVKHTTTMLKSDADLGVDIVRDYWRYGRIRLPGKKTTYARPTSLNLVSEVTHYPRSYTDDQVMAHWFYFKHIDQLTQSVLARSSKPYVLGGRPSWVREKPLLRSAV